MLHSFQVQDQDIHSSITSPTYPARSDGWDSDSGPSDYFSLAVHVEFRYGRDHHGPSHGFHRRLLSQLLFYYYGVRRDDNARALCSNGDQVLGLQTLWVQSDAYVVVLCCRGQDQGARG